jgi:hypothetical protein
MQYEVTFQAGDVKSLSLTDITERKFVRLYESKVGILQGVVNTGPQWDGGSSPEDWQEYDTEGETSRVLVNGRPEFSNDVLGEAGLVLFDEDGSHEAAMKFGLDPFYVLAVIEYEADNGRVGYLLRVRQITGYEPDAAFLEQYAHAGDVISATDKCVSQALDKWLFGDGAAGIAWAHENEADRSLHGHMLAEPTVAEYADEAIADDEAMA